MDQLRLQTIIACSIAALPLTAASAADSDLSYQFTPVLEADGLTAIAVTMRFDGDADGETVIELPDRWAGTGELYKGIANLTVEDGSIGAGADPAHRIVRHAPGAVLSLSYRVIPTDDRDPGPGYEKAHPVIRPRWFYIHGEGAILLPEGREDAPAHFAWGPAPDGWTLASDIDGASDLTATGVATAIFAGGGDWRVLTADAGGAPLRLAIRGEWDFTDEQLRDSIERIIAAENTYLSDDAIPYFVSLIPLTGAETGALSSGGTGRTHGFALAATRNNDLGDFLRTIAHEYGHRWFGNEFGPVAEDEAVEYWFTEGFGDFLAGRSLVASGVWTPADYARMLNRTLLRYGSSSARNTPNAELAEIFWEGPDPMQAPYDRGHLFALELDGAGDALKPALVRMATRPDSFDPAATQSERFLEAFPVDPPRLAAMLAGNEIALPVDLFAPCGAIGWAEQPAYAPGYSAERDEQGLYFTSVDEASPAWAAGLRPGMRYLKRISFEPGDASVPIVMRIADDDGEREISWLPAASQTARFQRLELDAGAGNDARCATRIGG